MKARRPPRNDAGITLAETVVSALAGAIVLIAAAALLVPTLQNSERANTGSQNVSEANTFSAQLQRQVLSATSVVTGTSGALRTLTLCTYPTVVSEDRSTVVWTFDSSTKQLTGTTYTAASAFKDVSFTPAAAAVAQGEPLTIAVSTSAETGSGKTKHVPITVLTIQASPGSTQNGSSCP